MIDRFPINVMTSYFDYIIEGLALLYYLLTLLRLIRPRNRILINPKLPRLFSKPLSG